MNDYHVLSSKWLAIEWYPDKNGMMKPGQGGLTIGIKHLPALADGFNKALAAAREHGLLVEVDGNDQ